jgi:hypothetical protein
MGEVIFSQYELPLLYTDRLSIDVFYNPLFIDGKQKTGARRVGYHNNVDFSLG